MHISLTSALVVGELSASRPGRFTPGERATDTNWIGGWVDPRAGLDDVENRKFLTQPLHRFYVTTDPVTSLLTCPNSIPEASGSYLGSHISRHLVDYDGL
jgi:hypothetical protein